MLFSDPALALPSPLAVGQLGEICVSGPQVMRGYWHRPEETAKAFFGGWLRTGDIGRMDADGFIFLEDRKKDMILVSQRRRDHRRGLRGPLRCSVDL